MAPRIKVGILGATGLMGQRYAAHLADHPRFRLSTMAASTQHVGKRYGDVISLADRKTYSDMLLCKTEELGEYCDWIFSSPIESVAMDIERGYAHQGKIVISSAAPWRLKEGIPLIIPEINGADVGMLPQQQRRWGWSGAILAKPNCAVQTFLLPIAPIHKVWGVKRAVVTMMQSLSGGGSQLIDRGIGRHNVLPTLRDEERKGESESQKILGKSIPFHVQSHRLPISHGHMASITLFLEKKASREEVITKWRSFPSLSLFSSPSHPLQVIEGEHRPQPARDLLHNGMSVMVGGVRVEEEGKLLHCVALSDNLERGGAGGGILLAEWLDTQRGKAWL
ncbi:MAG: aspartate-semialdehyde dehydrogenase [Chlamydiota bacterium]|nr:aspartate-semialdehyde dehydrogenase [Chlamydiota bacterium]